MQHLLLVRHGESVDNVAGVYAGSRDSALTAHGVLQARRLGAHLARSGDGKPSPVVTHVFSSDLQRAAQTAEAIVEAQNNKGKTGAGGGRDGVNGAGSDVLAVVQLADLREKDFRSGEGRRIASSRGDGGPSVSADAETRGEMRRRAERFVDQHLQPLLLLMVVADNENNSRHTAAAAAVVVVSHGIFLGVLLSALLQRFAAPSELSGMASSPVSWSNTGYVELAVRGRDGGSGKEQQQQDGPHSPGLSLAVTAVNSVEHLQGLKKTRGGIGSSAFDAKQRTMDSFFSPAAKRQKKGD